MLLIKSFFFFFFPQTAHWWKMVHLLTEGKTYASEHMNVGAVLVTPPTSDQGQAPRLWETAQLVLKLAAAAVAQKHHWLSKLGDAVVWYVKKKKKSHLDPFFRFWPTIHIQAKIYRYHYCIFVSLCFLLVAPLWKPYPPYVNAYFVLMKLKFKFYAVSVLADKTMSPVLDTSTSISQAHQVNCSFDMTHSTFWNFKMSPHLAHAVETFLCPVYGIFILTVLCVVFSNYIFEWQIVMAELNWASPKLQLFN